MSGELHRQYPPPYRFYPSLHKLKPFTPDKAGFHQLLISTLILSIVAGYLLYTILPHLWSNAHV